MTEVRPVSWMGRRRAGGRRLRPHSQGRVPEIRDGWDSQKNVEEQNWPVRMFRYFTEG